MKTDFKYIHGVENIKRAAQIAAIAGLPIVIIGRRGNGLYEIQSAISEVFKLSMSDNDVYCIDNEPPFEPKISKQKALFVGMPERFYLELYFNKKEHPSNAQLAAKVLNAKAIAAEWDDRNKSAYALLQNSYNRLDMTFMDVDVAIACAIAAAKLEGKSKVESHHIAEGIVYTHAMAIQQ
jgi:predicted ATPase with chaperone activity